MIRLRARCGENASPDLECQQRPDSPHRERKQTDADESCDVRVRQAESSHSGGETRERNHPHRLHRCRTIGFDFLIHCRLQ